MEIEVASVLAAVAKMQTSLEEYNRVEQEAIEIREQARLHDERALAAKKGALESIASVQRLLADIQLRNQPIPFKPVAEFDPKFPPWLNPEA